MKFACHISLYILAMLPSLAEAAVTIHEVAWMGSAASANHEWIELYNSGEAAVSLEGWTIRDGMNLEIALSGAVPPLSYVVLERTSDESAPGTAFLIYTGALVNTGATLVMRDATDGIVDQVAGGEDWKDIGGDNTTKETAQYTKAGWMTAAPTPGKENQAVGTDDPPADEEDEDTPKGDSPGSNSSEGTRLSRVPVSEMSIQFTLPSHVYVNEPIDFFATVTGVGDNFRQSLRYTWNFGDTYAERGQRATHSYEYAGTYVVQVWAGFGEREAVAQHTITVLPVTLSLTRNSVGDVQIHNDAAYSVDISRYTLSGQTKVLLPKGTVLLPRSTITVASHRLETSPFGSLVVLYDEAKDVVAMLSRAEYSLAAAVITTPPPPDNPRASVPVATEDRMIVETPLLLGEVAASPLSQSVTEVPVKEGSRWPFLSLLALLTGTLAVVWFAPRRRGEEVALVGDRPA